MGATEEDWITTEEAAQIAGFHVEYIRELVRASSIEGKKWGRSWMVSRNSLMKYLADERKPGPKPERPDRNNP